MHVCACLCVELNSSAAARLQKKGETGTIKKGGGTCNGSAVFGVCKFRGRKENVRAEFAQERCGIQAREAHAIVTWLVLAQPIVCVRAHAMVTWLVLARHIEV
jgi:hypothetical protein